MSANQLAGPALMAGGAGASAVGSGLGDPMMMAGIAQMLQGLNGNQSQMQAPPMMQQGQRPPMPQMPGPNPPVPGPQMAGGMPPQMLGQGMQGGQIPPQVLRMLGLA